MTTLDTSPTLDAPTSPAARQGSFTLGVLSGVIFGLLGLLFIWLIGQRDTIRGAAIGFGVRLALLAATALFVSLLDV